MKKLSIILLVLALAGGMAFGADLAIAGDVTFSTSFDLGAMAGGFDANANTLTYDASIVLIPGGSASASGEGDVYAVLEVSVADWTIAVDEVTAPAIPALGAISIDTFKIVAGDVTIDLLGASPAGNYVAYFDYDASGAADLDTAAIGLAGNNGGVDITSGDITVGVDFWYDGDVATTPPVPTTTFLLWGAYSADLAEGVTVSLAAGIDSAAGADAAAQISYAADAYSVVVGVDTADNFSLYEVEADIDAVIDIVTVDANIYYDSTDKLVRVADQNTIALEDLSIGLDFYYNDLNSGNYIAADVATDIDALSVALSGGFDYTAMSADVLLELGYAVSDATSVDAYVGYDMATSIKAGASLTQIIEAGTIVVSFDLNDDAVAADATATPPVVAAPATIDLAATFTSTTLVDGATVALGWAADDIANSLGAITASVKVSL